jgi:2-methylisocitrate lyase-like PEP mutase family enzyme
MAGGYGMSLKTRLTQTDILVAPGVYDGLTAGLAATAGFEALYLSGAAVAYTRLGRPDIGLTSVSEMADTMTLIADRVDLPVIIDADTGFGNALNAQRTMRLYERAGASALQVEDQTYPKRCGHLKDKSLIPAVEMAGKVSAMADARQSQETLIVARTDAIAVEGLSAAIDRAELYLEAGAEITQTFAARIPLLANMVEGGATPITSAADLQERGFSIAIFPGGIVRALARTGQEYYASLHKNGSNRPFADRMFDFDGLNNVIGTDEMLAKGAKYEGKD